MKITVLVLWAVSLFVAGCGGDPRVGVDEARARCPEVASNPRVSVAVWNDAMGACEHACTTGYEDCHGVCDVQVVSYTVGGSYTTDADCGQCGRTCAGPAVCTQHPPTANYPHPTWDCDTRPR
jgi:hypothetical protein